MAGSLSAMTCKNTIPTRLNGTLDDISDAKLSREKLYHCRIVKLPGQLFQIANNCPQYSDNFTLVNGDHFPILFAVVRKLRNNQVDGFSIYRFNGLCDDDAFYNFSRFQVFLWFKPRRRPASFIYKTTAFIYCQAAVPQATTHKIRTSVQHDVQFLQDLQS
ncbi:hypothetical protein T10_4196 [Trichinella papuae]|uniref:Uncharacterized protein n=1 Tax=Trichinella papuae TaxID=268474 RepID=A0A0V1MBX3_9BILA|nr:hypothetical protein T10_4196 [Trichinella papuae]